MDPITGFFIALGMLFVLAVATLVCVQRPLNDILIEICGAPHHCFDIDAVNSEPQ